MKKRTEKVTAMEEFSKGIAVLEATTYIGGTRVVGVRKKVLKKASDQYAVATKKRRDYQAPLPRKVSWVCSQFLQQGGTVTGHRKYSADLAQGGLEVPELVSRARLRVRVWPARLFPDLYISRQC